MEIRMYAEPALLPASGLAGGMAIVIDALRMTSTCATAVAHGCKGILPVPDLEAAREAARAYGALLGGERKAKPVAGFDFDNSPLHYPPERVAGRLIVISTTNGARAVRAAQGADQVLLGAFINASAAAGRVRKAEKLAILCAGTQGAFSLDDVLAAGAILSRLTRGTGACRLDDMALAAISLYAQAQGNLHGALRDTAHYQRLQSLGLKEDLAYCLKEDTLKAVPERGGDGWFA